MESFLTPPYTINENQLIEKNAVYDNGNKRFHVVYLDTAVIKAEGWNEDGTEIKDFIVQRKPQFKGGMKGWKRYLENHLNANVAAQAGAPRGIYTVKVEFDVDKEGNVSNVKLKEVPENCFECGDEAIKIIARGPKWEPAIQFGKPVLYRAFQFISFSVVGY